MLIHHLAYCTQFISRGCLLATAFALSGLSTKRETVDAALSEFIQRRRAPELIELFGTADYDPSYDYKQLRQRNGEAYR